MRYAGYCGGYGEGGLDLVHYAGANEPYGDTAVFGTADGADPDRASRLRRRHFDHGQRSSWASGQTVTGQCEIFSGNGLYNVSGDLSDGYPSR